MSETKENLNLDCVNKRELAEFLLKEIEASRNVMDNEYDEYSNNYSFHLGKKDFAERILSRFT
jgi:hypothetical protein